jgi:hypothetical protein
MKDDRLVLNPAGVVDAAIPSLFHTVHLERRATDQHRYDMRMRLFSMMVAVAALASSGCKDARRGQSSESEAPVPDGRVVLLKRTNEVAAFILKNQS